MIKDQEGVSFVGPCLSMHLGRDESGLTNQHVSAQSVQQLLRQTCFFSSCPCQALVFSVNLLLSACVWCCRRAEVDIPAPRWMPFMALHYHHYGTDRITAGLTLAHYALSGHPSAFCFFSKSSVSSVECFVSLAHFLLLPCGGLQYALSQHTVRFRFKWLCERTHHDISSTVFLPLLCFLGLRHPSHHGQPAERGQQGDQCPVNKDFVAPSMPVTALTSAGLNKKTL